MKPWSIVGTAFAAVIVCLGSVSIAADEGAPTRPNVLFILSDDLGYSDLGCYGSDFYETPVLDKLAKGGVRFVQAYAACPVCSPSRSAIMSGKFPARTGVTDYIHKPQDPKKVHQAKGRLMDSAPFAQELALDEVTVAEAFKEAGYGTFAAGKWHLGGKGFSPLEQGFDGWVESTKKEWPGTTKLADAASDYIRNNHDKPFFVYLSFHAVHIPLAAPQDLIKKYEAKRARLGLDDKFTSDADRTVRMNQSLPVYGAMLEDMDQAIGSVLKTLDDQNLTTNTIVVFTSDNGGLSTKQGWPTSNRPLRCGKGFAYEGGIRVPLIVRWPGQIESGKESNSVVAGSDHYPTLLSLAGIPEKPRQTLDGKSYAEALKKPSSDVDRGAIFWHYPHYGDQGGNPASAVRDGDWKLIYWYERDETNLFNLKQDIGEQKDLAKEMPEKAKELKDKLDAWLKEAGAKFPKMRKN